MDDQNPLLGARELENLISKPIFFLAALGDHIHFRAARGAVERKLPLRRDQLGDLLYYPSFPRRSHDRVAGQIVEAGNT